MTTYDTDVGFISLQMECKVQVVGEISPEEDFNTEEKSAQNRAWDAPHVEIGAQRSMVSVKEAEGGAREGGNAAERK